jgi:cell division protein FtsI/penicillin-binding protein 2
LRRARQRELARLAAIRRHDEQLRATAARNIAADSLEYEDTVVRAAALEALGDRAGTVVVMDPNNGRVLSMVNQRMAVGVPVKPCSTIKTLVALTALSERLLTVDDLSQTLRACQCEMEMDDALAYSNNEYFQNLGRQIGLKKLLEYARIFGFGERTGINMPGESPGLLPTAVPADGLGRVASHGDGIGVTALQLAAFTSAIANGGSLYQPQLVRADQTFTPVLRRQLPIEPHDRRAILEGMTGAVNYGTAKKARGTFDQVAGKTGSCLGNGSWVGLFTSFSSVESPNLVVIVVTQGSTARGPRSADVAGHVYRTLAPHYGSLANRPRRVEDGVGAVTEPAPEMSDH